MFFVECRRAALTMLMVGHAWLWLGCNGGSDPPALGDSGRTTGGPTQCKAEAEGCPCSEEGARVECGEVVEEHGSYVTCSMGSRACADGVWTACVGERITLRGDDRDGSLREQGLGVAEECPEGFDACDPYCHRVVDTPLGVEPGPGFEASADGVTLTEVGVGNCTALTLTASDSEIIVTALDPIAASPSDTVSFEIEATPDGCADDTYAVTWTVDKLDRVLVTGTTNQDGELSVAAPIAGSVTVTAYAVGLNASTDVSLRVNVLETPETNAEAAPNFAANSTQRAAFGPFDTPNPGTVASSALWLYPYENTYFPLGLPPPAMQYWYTNTSGSTSDRSVKLSLRYPVGSSVADADFNYSLVVREANGISQTEGVAANVLDPQVEIPDIAWQYFEQTARGQDAELLVQRRRGTTLEQELGRSVHFVDAQLKGTVYYNSYTSPKANYTGAVLSISPGADEPDVAVQPSGRCTVCHSINLDGTRLIANGRRSSGGVWFNNSQRYDLTDADPSTAVLNSYDAAGGVDTENVPGDRYTFGGPWTDGSLYMTHGGRASSRTGVGDPNWRAPPAYSRLYSPNDPYNDIDVTDWPRNMLAVTPKFSPDGTKLAFGYWGGSSLDASPSGTLSRDENGRRMAVVDFDCETPPCSASSNDWYVENARDLTPSVSSGVNDTSGTLKVAWPSFTPAGDAVMYQRQYRTSRSSSDGGVLNYNWSPSDINTVAGALAELWLSDVPEDSDTDASPTRLLALNGLNSDGTSSYLPEDDDRPTSPGSYHRSSGSGASFGIQQADWCSNTGTATGVLNYRLNYLPAFNPTEAGGFSWVVFTSRRMYGNIATNDPWDAEPGSGCESGEPPTKKLWVAAIDSEITPGSDPSHPAFYLPGQELGAGNSEGYWVNSPCVAVGGSCASDDDCCDATGASPLNQCRVVSTSTVPPVSECQPISQCSSVGQACTTTDDCCAGTLCPDSGGVCIVEPVPIYETAVLEREYVAECPSDMQVVWRFFEWQATIPDGATIEFFAQTKEEETDDYLPETALSIGTASTTTPAGSWHRGSETVDDVLDQADPTQTSGKYLLVTMRFNPDSDAQNAPILNTWRQIFDCMPAE